MGIKARRVDRSLPDSTLQELAGARLVANVFRRASVVSWLLAVLDRGAEKAPVTRTFLELGARVTAVDVFRRQLEALTQRNADFSDRLTIEPGDAFETVARLRSNGACFDIVAAISFLHHVPDCLAVIRTACGVLATDRQLFIFQAPDIDAAARPQDRARRLRSVAPSTAQRAGRVRTLCPATTRHLARRLPGGQRRVPRASRRRRPARDPRAARELGFDVEIFAYFSTQSPLGQRLGERLRARNKFALVASRGHAADARG
jgi:hypothetical protein